MSQELDYEQRNKLQDLEFEKNVKQMESEQSRIAEDNLRVQIEQQATRDRSDSQNTRTELAEAQLNLRQVLFAALRLGSLEFGWLLAGAAEG